MPLKKASFFIDGFNLYHSIADTRELKKYKWLNLWSLCEKFIIKKEEINSVFYFTAYADWKPPSASRHRAYVAANQHFGCQPIFGKFIEKDRISLVKCYQPCNPSGSKSKCKKKFKIHEEKMTDVNIAVYLLKTCITGACDAAYLISGDNDLIPALVTAHELCPAVDIRVVTPPNARARNLTRICNEHNFKYLSINENHLKMSLLPNPVISGEKTYTCPPGWA